MTPTPLDPRRIVPAHKTDLEAVQNLQRANAAAIIAQAGPLLEWTQDGNWPVGWDISPVLRPYVNDIVPELVEILRGNEDSWREYCISEIIRPSPVTRLAPALLTELRRIADFPQDERHKWEPIDLAQEVWEEWIAKEPG